MYSQFFIDVNVYFFVLYPIFVFSVCWQARAQAVSAPVYKMCI